MTPLITPPPPPPPVLPESAIPVANLPPVASTYMLHSKFFIRDFIRLVFYFLSWLLRYVFSLLSITFTGSSLRVVGSSSIVFFSRFLKISLCRMAQARLPERRPSSSDDLDDFFCWKGYRVPRSEVDSSPKVIQHEARDYILVEKRIVIPPPPGNQYFSPLKPHDFCAPLSTTI